MHLIKKYFFKWRKCIQTNTLSEVKFLNAAFKTQNSSSTKRGRNQVIDPETGRPSPQISLETTTSKRLLPPPIKTEIDGTRVGFLHRHFEPSMKIEIKNWKKKDNYHSEKGSERIGGLWGQEGLEEAGVRDRNGKGETERAQAVRLRIKRVICWYFLV